MAMNKRACRIRETEGLDGEDACGLRERLNDQNARHDRTTREMTLENPSLIVTALIAVIEWSRSRRSTRSTKSIG